MPPAPEAWRMDGSAGPSSFSVNHLDAHMPDAIDQEMFEAPNNGAPP